MFTRVVWSVSNGRAAFARRGSYVMAWYCPSGGSSGINMGGVNAYTINVKPDSCPKPCKDNIAIDLYSRCYNPKAVTAHNAKRTKHRVPDLQLDVAIAKRA